MTNANDRIRRHGPILRRFAGDRGGNFAIIAALAMTPIILAMGGSLDVTTAMSRGSDLQAALDAAALAVARRPAEMTDKAGEVAEAYFLANFGESLPLDLNVTSSKVTIKAKYDYKTAFLTIMNMKNIPVERSSEVTLATNTREIALVLDTTGSMLANNKLVNMQAAATRLVKDLAADATASGNTTRFALVPFSSFVNAGLQTNGKPQSWVDAAGLGNPVMSEFPKGFSRLDLYAHLGETWRGCIESRTNGQDVLDTAPNTAKPETLFVPSFAPDESDAKYGSNHSYANDYLTDNAGNTRMFDLANNFAYNGRSSPNGSLLADVISLGENGNSGTFKKDSHPLTRYGVTVNNKGVIQPKSSWLPAVRKLPYKFFSNQSDPQGPNTSCVSDPVIPLTTDAKKIRDAIGALTAEGSTNIVEGASWGWKVLSPTEPFTEGTSYDNEENDKIMVLLTDGSNDLTALPVSGNQKGTAYSSYNFLYDGYLRSANGDVVKKTSDMKAAMDARVVTICTNAKKAGVNVFTILLEVTDATTTTMLRSCASSPSQFYNAQKSAELEKMFDDIRGKISRLRVSR